MSKRPKLLAGGNPQDVRENDALDEARFVDWVKQASRLPGWKP